MGIEFRDVNRAKEEKNGTRGTVVTWENGGQGQPEYVRGTREATARRLYTEPPWVT